MRSILDPLPRFPSTRGLATVVGMLLLGTAISVYEYLEDSRPPARHPACESSASRRCTTAARGSIEQAARSRTTGVPDEEGTAPAPAEAPPAQPGRTTPSLWQPDELR